MPQLNLPATIETVRPNELPLYSQYGPLSTDDYFIVWLAAFNKTCKIDTQSIYDYIHTGDSSGTGGGTTAPVVIGDKMIHVITADEAGGVSVVIPSIAGQNFFLERDGLPMLTTEFSVLNAGGFKLEIPGDVLIENQRFVLTLYSLQAGGSAGGGGTTAAASLIKGVVPISINTAFDTVNHVGKLLQFRSGSTQVTLTLPSIADIPQNTIIPIESNLSTTAENKIVTQGGQSIYMLSTSRQSLYIRPGEVLWLYRGEDGYYILNDFYRSYTELAQPRAAYRVGLNELACKGQLLSRQAYPRLWEAVQGLSGSLVSDTLWQTTAVYRQGNTYTTTPPAGEYQTIEFPYRGCFSSGDGSTTFRLPDLLGMFLRGVISESGSDDERYYNKAGGYQAEEMKAHSHEVVTGGIQSGADPGRSLLRGAYAGDDPATYGVGASAYGPYISTEGGTETRPENIGVLWVIKC